MLSILKVFMKLIEQETGRKYPIFTVVETAYMCKCYVCVCCVSVNLTTSLKTLGRLRCLIHPQILRS